MNGGDTLIVIEDYLIEIKRSEFVKTAKEDTKERYQKRTEIFISRFAGMSPDDFYGLGDLKFYFDVLSSSGESYRTTINIINYIPTLVKYLRTGEPRYQAIRHSLADVASNNDIKVHCTCPDFQYRFQYIATQKGYLATPPGVIENRPPNITNPNLKGLICKHLIHVINRPTEWYPYMSSWIRKLLDWDPSVIEKFAGRVA